MICPGAPPGKRSSGYCASSTRPPGAHTFEGGMRPDTAVGGASQVGRYIVAGGLRTHYLDFPGGDPPIVLLHGVSANAHAFGGLVAAGLSPSFRVLAPDLRGR